MSCNLLIPGRALSCGRFLIPGRALLRGRSLLRALAAITAAGILCGCASVHAWLPSDGPSRKQVQASPGSQRIQGIQVISVNDAVARELLSKQKQGLFSETVGKAVKSEYAIGLGDVVEVSVWEAPPATLFGSVAVEQRPGLNTSHATTFPEQMVGSDGTINVPFAGKIQVSGHSPQQVEKEVEDRLKTKANQPQALVRVIHNNSEYVTVVGEVTSSTRMPLTSSGEKLLDALAAAGGIKHPVTKTMIQLTRGEHVYSLPLGVIITDPNQNIALQTGDVITALLQPLSFTVLGATGKNEEVDFEAQGITLAQALARAGGLADARADAKGVFIFRFESLTALDWPSKPMTTPDGKVPAIYWIDFKDPASFFVAQTFPVKNKDLIYVSNAPAAELQKFLNIVGSITSPVLNMGSNASGFAR